MTRIARLSELASTKEKPGRVPVSAATIWRWVNAGTFPAPYKLGPNITVWDLDEVEAFLSKGITK
jgi:predicted DNA-binding transcriptional regulator AlpA